MQILVVLIVTHLCLSQSQNSAKIYEICKQEGIIQKVKLNDCTKSPCLLQRGKNAYLSLTFQTKHAVENLKLNIVGTIWGAEFTFIKEVDVCTGAYNVNCPLKPYTNYEFRKLVKVEKIYPAWKVTIKARLFEESLNQPLICVQMPVKIR